MSIVTSVVDPKTLFDRWFDKAIAKLEELESGDGGTTGMMVVLPLFERYIDILEANDTSQRERYEIMAAELQVATALDAEKFWTTFRHGFCHTGMPFERGRRIKALPKVRLPLFVATGISHRAKWRRSRVFGSVEIHPSRDGHLSARSYPFDPPS